MNAHTPIKPAPIDPTRWQNPAAILAELDDALATGRRELVRLTYERDNLRDRLREAGEHLAALDSAIGQLDGTMRALEITTRRLAASVAATAGAAPR